MWFLGALLGLIVGGIVDEWEGALAGATLGAFVGAILGAARRAAAGNPELVARVASLETQVQKIAYGFELAKQRIATLEGGAPAASEPHEQAVPIPPVEELPQVVAAAALEPAIAAAPAEPEPTAAPDAPALADEPQWTPPAPAERPFWWKWLFGGNTLVRAGIAILFVGVAFLVKYAAEHAHFPVELRLASIAVGGIAMLVIGWRLRDKRAGYALSMQGGGIGVLYLTVFAALRLYSMLPPALAFALMVVVVVASALLAVLQDAMALALIGTAGGFLAPVLTSTGQGSHVALFSYYMLLNLGIFGIAWAKAWRPLNVAGFLFTFVISGLWGWKNYSQEFFSTTEPFLIAFFLLYVGIALLYALRRSIEVTHYVDGTLVFGVPIVAFGLQSQLVRNIEYGLAFSALALGAFYIVLARALWSRRGQGLTLLTESFLALGIVFATLAVPLALDGKWTSAAWALEGAAVVWIGGRQNRKLAQWFGILLQFAAGIAFIASSGGPVQVQPEYAAKVDDFGLTWPVFNSLYLGRVFIAFAGWFCGYCVHRRGEKLAALAPVVSGVLFVWALLWWTAAGGMELERFVEPTYLVNADIGFFAASALVFCIVHPRLQWKMLLLPQGLLLPVLYLLALAAIAKEQHAFANFGWVAWPAAIAVVYWILRRREDEFGNFVASATHACALWLLTGLACWEVGYGIDRFVEGSGTWPYVAWAIVPGLALAAVSRYGKDIAWPVAPRLALYMTVCAAPMLVYLYAWAICVNILSDGDPSPLVYVPLLNPLDIATFLVLLALTLWYVRLRVYSIAKSIEPRTAGAAIGAAAFIWLTASLLRTLHHWAGIPFDHTAMFHSMLAQASLSVFWTVLACALMLFATRRGLRILWMVGGSLLIVVVVKLFFFDLAEISGIARIVSFIGVGVLLLAIGYFSPVPPRRIGEKTT
jgi:uncharacterized membrane protein